MRPIYLNSQEKSDLSNMSLYFIVKDNETNYSEYSASNNGVYMKNPIQLYVDEEGIIHNYSHGNTLKVCPYGDLLSHGNNIRLYSK